MKQTIFTFLLFTAIAVVSCKKNTTYPDIKTYDEDQMKLYISANGLTGMQRDTSGIYYKILTAGTGAILDYPDSVGFAFTLHSFDGKYISEDTITNHYEDFLGHIVANGHPLGLQMALHNLANRVGTRVRVLIPSHLAFGVNGTGSGSSSLTNARIGGNQCLDYYVNIVGNQDAYDQLVIKNYMAVNGLSSTMTQDPSGLWYLISKPGPGTVPITNNTTITATYTLTMLNTSKTIIDQFNSGGGTSIDIPDIIVGMQIALKKYASAGTLMTVLIPSKLGTGKNINGSAPPNSCVRYDIQVVDVK
jgi:FKBP-type peptidyl-prolyl cis-trans isomerase